VEEILEVAMSAKIEKVDHIGIAVRSIAERVALYRDVLGLEYLGEEEVASQGVRVAFFRAGESMIELLEPLDETGPIARFLERHGEGIHHLALGCQDIEVAREAARRGGLRLLSEEALDGAHGKLISFVHPRDTGGVLMEFTQRGKADE
jgi:methylmalonyl-CoA/ethylmalonyl-CoA epimerase